jgi:hypothetical protein
LNIRSPIVAAALTLALGTLAVGRASDAPERWFTDATAASGLNFTQFSGMSSELYYPEIMPPGLALFDYDNGGDLDVLVVQGLMLGPKAINARGIRRATGRRSAAALFRNDLGGPARSTRSLARACWRETRTKPQAGSPAERLTGWHGAHIPCSAS